MTTKDEILAGLSDVTDNMEEIIKLISEYNDKNKPKFVDLPEGLPVSAYPELNFIENKTIIKKSLLPLEKIEKIEEVLSNYMTAIPFFGKYIHEEFVPIFNDLCMKCDKTNIFSEKKSIVDNEIVPFFTEWILFMSSYLLSSQKIRFLNINSSKNIWELN